MFPFLWLGIGFALKWLRSKGPVMYDFFLTLLSFTLIVLVLYLHAAWWMALMVLVSWLVFVAFMKVE